MMGPSFPHRREPLAIEASGPGLCRGDDHLAYWEA
jgi:hypothetical protein